jgi:ABC-2 type transport system ATP-binding protein
MSKDTVLSPGESDHHSIWVSELSKSYRTGFWLNKIVTPLSHCSLQVKYGETFGLLGPNGAGKTTTLKCLLGIVDPSAGSGFLLGKPLGDRQIKQQVGYLPENPYFYDYLTAWEFLHFIGGLFCLSRSLLAERIPALLELVGLPLDTARKRQLRTYSKGMLQRTGMAQALINDPKLIFLDEPMSGLDPIGRYQMREIILSLKKQGKTVFFNSHILGDVEIICDQIGILVGGKMICQGSLDSILGTTETYQVKGKGGTLGLLKEHFQQIECQGDSWYGEWLGSPKACFQILEEAQAVLTDFNLRRQSLEAFFVEKVRSHQGKQVPLD